MLTTEGNENRENFSSLKTFENLILLNNSSDNLETELNKANNYSSNKNQNNNSKILHTNNSNSDLENDSVNINFNSINNNKNNLKNINSTNTNKNEFDEYENLAYKPSDLQEINKQSIKIPGLDERIVKNSFGQIKNYDKSENNNNDDCNNYNNNNSDNNNVKYDNNQNSITYKKDNDLYFQAKINIKEIKTQNNFLPSSNPSNEQTLNLSDKSLNNTNNENNNNYNIHYNLNKSNPIIASSGIGGLNLKSESFMNTSPRNKNAIYLSDFNNKNNDSHISLANSSCKNNLKRDLLLDNTNNILEQLTSAEKKKYSFDFHLNKENSFKQKTKRMLQKKN